MRTRQARRPFSQNLVIGLALGLALVLAYFSVKKLADTPAQNDRRWPASGAPLPPAGKIEAPRTLEISPSYSAVSALPGAGPKKTKARGMRRLKAPPPPK